LLRSLQEIQPDFVEEAKAYAGLWSQGKKKKKKRMKKEGMAFQKSLDESSALTMMMMT
jgi:hypothetical protein